MQGLSEAIKYLYQQFILRDVVAYVTPGTILVACALTVYLGNVKDALAFIKQIPAIGYVPIYGLLFITGLGIQYLGEMLKVLREHNRSTNEERFAKLEEFHRATAAHQLKDGKSDYSGALERTRERIEVKKYASGNIAAAMVISGILILVTRVFPFSGRWALVSIGAILVVSLRQAHLQQVKNVTYLEDAAIKSQKGSV